MTVKAIKYATVNWKADIISMSFGWPRWHECVEKAIKAASDNNIILFAAASNNGSNQTTAFPASCPPVICVHSASGYGDPSPFTPRPFGSINLAVIGEGVISSWPQSRGEGPGRRSSGTSVATPILAAIAALVLEFVNQKPSLTPHDLRLRSPRGMAQVLLGMSSRHHTGYDVVMPWQVLDTQIGRVRSEGRIADHLERLFGPASST